MKFNKTKLFLLGLVFGTYLSILSVNAASLSIKTVSTTDNEAKYELYLVGIKDTDNISNLTINIDSSNGAATKSITKADNITATCNNNGCNGITITGTGDVKIANITLSNGTTATIDNLLLTASASGYTSVSSPAVSLKSASAPVTTEPVKSSKATLSGLTVTSGTISPTFSENEKNYTINDIKDTISSITFNPTCERCQITYTCKENCSVSTQTNGRIMIEEGANIVVLTSKSEDGKNTAEYTFTIYRGEIEEPSAYLTDLSLKDATLSPKFDMLLNDYTVTVDKDVEKLDITYTLEDPKASVEIKGNDKLKDGENTVTITVTSSDSKSKQVYTIIVTKEDICDPEKEDCEGEEKLEETKIKKKKNTWLIVLLSVIGVLIIGGVGFILFKKKKKKNKDNKDDKNKPKKGKKLKDMLVEPEEEEEETVEENEVPLQDETIASEDKEENIITPRVKPSVEDALEDLMKTKEIELKD